MIHNCEPGLIAHCTYSTQAYGLRVYPQNMLRNWSDKAAAATHEAPQNMTPRRDDMQKTAKDNPNGDASNAPLAVPVASLVAGAGVVPGPACDAPLAVPVWMLVPVPVPVLVPGNEHASVWCWMPVPVSVQLSHFLPLQSTVDVAVPLQSAVA